MRGRHIIRRSVASLLVAGVLTLSGTVCQAAAGDWLTGTTTAQLLKGGNIEGSGANGASSFSFAEQVISKSQSLSQRYGYLQHLIKRANETIAEEVAPDTLVLFDKQQRDREFCFTEHCVADWLEDTIGAWEEIIDGIDRDKGEDILAQKLRETVFVSDLMADRNQAAHASFSTECLGTKNVSAAGCFMATFKEVKNPTGYFDASCQRGRGAPSGISCAMLGITPALGIKGQGNQVTWKADAMYEKACYLGPGSSCLTLGDWYFLNGVADKAKDAYKKASSMGEEQSLGRLQLMADSPLELIAWIQSHPTPSQSDWLRRCAAPYGDTENVIDCLKVLEPSQNKRLKNILFELDIEQVGMDLMELAIKKVASTVASMAGRSRNSVHAPRYHSLLASFQNTSRMIERLSYLANQGGDGNGYLADSYYSRCKDERCATLATLKTYLKEKYEETRNYIRESYGEDKKSASVLLDALTWIQNANEELATRLAYELKGYYDPTTLEALVRSDMLEYEDMAKEAVK